MLGHPHPPLPLCCNEGLRQLFCPKKIAMKFRPVKMACAPRTVRIGDRAVAVDHVWCAGARVVVVDALGFCGALRSLEGDPKADWLCLQEFFRDGTSTEIVSLLRTREGRSRRWWPLETAVRCLRFFVSRPKTEELLRGELGQLLSPAQRRLLDEDDDVCVICLASLAGDELTKSLECPLKPHSMHAACHDEWVALCKERPLKCPLCRCRVADPEMAASLALVASPSLRTAVERLWREGSLCDGELEHFCSGDLQRQLSRVMGNME